MGPKNYFLKFFILFFLFFKISFLFVEMKDIHNIPPLPLLGWGITRTKIFVQYTTYLIYHLLNKFKILQS